MAKQAPTKTTTSKSESKASVPARTAQGGGKHAVPSHLQNVMKTDAGRGVSKDLADNIVPLIYILQAQSPQVLKQKPEYLGKGVEAGDIWFRGTKFYVKGDEGITVQPCFFAKVWMEWKPNRGGLAGRHMTKPKDAVQKENDKGKLYWELPNKNTVNESREHVVIVRGCDVLGKDTAFVIPMTGSQHGTSRGWMTLMNGKSMEGGGTPPSWACLYKMTTVPLSNEDGDWFGWAIEDESGDGSTSWVESLDHYEQGKKISSQFDSGELRADSADDAPDQTGETAAEDDEADI